jgi:hypothetical protein
MSERIEVSRVIAAEPGAIFAVLRDPAGHVEIDASGMLQSHTGEPASKVGDVFTVHMDREALGDMPEIGRYDVEVHIETYDQDREIAWSIVGIAKPPLGHVYGYRLEPVAGGTRVISYYDWSAVRDDWKHRFPIVPESALKGTLGILARTVRARM